MNQEPLTIRPRQSGDLPAPEGSPLLASSRHGQRHSIIARSVTSPSPRQTLKTTPRESGPAQPEGIFSMRRSRCGSSSTPHTGRTEPDTNSCSQPTSTPQRLASNSSSM